MVNLERAYCRIVHRLFRNVAVVFVPAVATQQEVVPVNLDQLVQLLARQLAEVEAQ